MNFSFSSRLMLQVLLLVAVLCGLACCISIRWWYGLLLIILVLYQCNRLIILNRRLWMEFLQLVETVRYRDFSRHFDTRSGPAYLRQTHEGMNEICDTITAVNREKEMQYQYLQAIIEMVDTGILSYRLDSGEVLWMNQSLKNLLGIPIIKNFHALRQRNEPLYESLQSLGNERSTVIPITRDNGQSKALVAAGTFTMQEIQYRLLAFQNVNEALDEAESKAWQRLLNVMTHEIMNSVAPISSLAGTLKNLLAKTSDKSVSPESVVEDIELGIDTIMRRSQGLLSFAETYRNLSRITELNISKVQVSALFEHISQLMLPSLTQKNIDLEVILKDPLMDIEADTSLIEQVLINLILNSIEAVKEKPEPHMILSAALNVNKRPVIRVTDNGAGIPDEVMDKIFIPFFSTRKNGNGIGLSLCKQIMMLHHGNIQVQTVVGEGTSFCLLF
ncbi:MAG: sensor histidine kinase [Bacteroidales bacterium]|nr:sensor histidine kinase [Bacteroidales bacterium]